MSCLYLIEKRYVLPEFWFVRWMDWDDCGMDDIEPWVWESGANKIGIFARDKNESEIKM